MNDVCICVFNTNILSSYLNDKFIEWNVCMVVTIVMHKYAHSPHIHCELPAPHVDWTVSHIPNC